MKARLPLPQRFALLGTLLLIMSACAFPLAAGNRTPTATATADAAAVPAIPDTADGEGLPTETNPLPVAVNPLPEVQPTTPSSPTLPVLQPTATFPIQVATAPSLPQINDPFVTTRRMTEARVGPGFHYVPSHTLGQGTQSPVQGRSPDGQWWAIPGPGDGPGPLAWIQAADADFFGDASSLPVLSPPSGGIVDLPVHSDPGSPPSNACVVVPLGSDLGPVLIHLGPGKQFNAHYRLGGWAEVLKSEAGWHMILLGPGETGWVNRSEVQTSGPCS